MKNPTYAVLTLPESVKIGPYRYRVILKKHITTDDGKDLYGWIRHTPQTIHVQSGVSPSRTLAILMHEVLHGIDEAVDAGLTEEQIARLSPLLADVLTANRLLREDWLTMIEDEASGG